MNSVIYITLIATHLTLSASGKEINTSDTIKYRKIECGLFISNQGDIAYLATMMLNENGDKGTRYINWIYGADPKNTLGNAGLMEMKSVIDTLTFKFLSWIYWSDKNRVYSYNLMSDGGTVLYIQNADPATFKALDESPYAKDKHNVFYKGQPIDGADIKSFKIIKDKKIPELAKDKNKYYFSGDPLTEAELAELKKK